MKLLVKNGLFLSPVNQVQQYFDVLINGSRIKKIEKEIFDKDALIIDAKGKIVVPGLIDVHVHFREPGQEHKETIASGSRAAAAGGFTTVVAEANTDPPIDTPARVRNVLDIARKNSIVNFYTKAATTQEMRGTKLIDIEGVKIAGAVAISDDGNPVPTEELMRDALIKAKSCNILLNPHCEESVFYQEMWKRENNRRDFEFPDKMPYSSKPGTLFFSETGFIERDIKLAEEIGARLHISHVSLASSVKVIADAKQRGVAVTAEATPHHFLLTEEDAKKIGPNAKVNPPLRSKEDVEAIKSGLADGTIDVIATDHAPHSPQEKSVPWEDAPFGIIGLETALGLVLTFLVQPGYLTLMQAIDKMSTTPARIFGIETGGFKPGAQADLTVIDPNKKWKVDVKNFYSKGRNCPFDGWELQGKPVMTIVRGQIAMQEGEVIQDQNLRNEFAGGLSLKVGNC